MARDVTVTLPGQVSVGRPKDTDWEERERGKKGVMY